VVISSCRPLDAQTLNLEYKWIVYIHFKQGLKQINQNVAPISGMRLNNLIETIRGYCQLFLTELSDGAKQKKKKKKN
jgi:hypothetical protein